MFNHQVVQNELLTDRHQPLQELKAVGKEWITRLAILADNQIDTIETYARHGGTEINHVLILNLLKIVFEDNLDRCLDSIQTFDPNNRWKDIHDSSKIHVWFTNYLKSDAFKKLSPQLQDSYVKYSYLFKATFYLTLALAITSIVYPLMASPMLLPFGMIIALGVLSRVMAWASVQEKACINKHQSLNTFFKADSSSDDVSNQFLNACEL